MRITKDSSMTSKEFIAQCKEKRTEHQEQVEVVKYLRRNKILHYAVPNGANKSRTAQRQFSAEGLMAGVPDLCIPVSNKYYHGLYIEMKRRVKTLKSGKKSVSHTKVSPEQEKWLTELNEHGYYAVVCYGADEAIEVIEEYMENRA